ncbi:hypothetical protein F5B17DRAFT_117464 [Nemania serpens]|nr:hypothetical protein F5B17DRAFT_117464 [Nemania serpens]
MRFYGQLLSGVCFRLASKIWAQSCHFQFTEFEDVMRRVGPRWRSLISLQSTLHLCMPSHFDRHRHSLRSISGIRLSRKQCSARCLGYLISRCPSVRRHLPDMKCHKPPIDEGTPPK